MLGKGASDSALAHAAAEGDGEAFRLLFARHLTAVFETAWRVLNDRGAAAEVTFETFADAWRRRHDLPPSGWGAALVASAGIRARGWLDAHPEAVPMAEQRLVVTSPGLGPTLRARIVNALEAQGVPTWTTAPIPIVGAHDHDDRSPTSATSATSVSPLSASAAEAEGEGGEGLLAGTGIRVFAAVAAVLVLVTMGIVLNAGSGANANDGDRVETGSTLPDQDETALGPTTTGLAKRGATTTAASSSTTSSSSSSTSTSSTTTTEPEASSTSAPSTTPTTAAPPPPPPSSTTTAPRPPAPEITRFYGWFSYNGNCYGSQRTLSIRWETQNATSGRIRRDGGDWYNVRQLPNGGFDVCSSSGTRWYLEVSGSGGSDSASFTAQ